MQLIGPKLGKATRRTEVVGLPLILIGTGCRGRLHRHPAHGIDSRSPRHGRDRLHHWQGSSCGQLSRTYWPWLQRLLRICLESFQARQAAKVVALASMVVTSGCCSRIDRHPADWIERHHNTVKCETLDAIRSSKFRKPRTSDLEPSPVPLVSRLTHH